MEIKKTRGGKKNKKKWGDLFLFYLVAGATSAVAAVRASATSSRMAGTVGIEPVFSFEYNCLSPTLTSKAPDSRPV